jgi:hypothetical protein
VELNVNKYVIAPGSAVTVRVEGTAQGAAVSGTVRTPAGREFPLAFARSDSSAFESVFTNTTDMGVLTPDWNRYVVAVNHRSAAGVQQALTNSFVLQNSAKCLYFVLWVDDFGATGEFPKRFRDWYRRHAGPISYLLQKDDTRFYNMKRLLSAYDFGYDYLAHHFHAYWWPGSRILLNLENRVYAPFLTWRYYFRNKVGIDLFRVGNVALVWCVFVLAFVVGYIRRRKTGDLLGAAACVLLLAGFIFLRANHERVRNRLYWRYEHSNTPWCMAFLANARKEFESCGFAFPSVVRNGWNLPPPGIMAYYMGELGVLADATGVSGLGTNSFLEGYAFYDRTMYWPARTMYWPARTTPYYASLSRDYNVEWNGDEADRGMLEVPLTFEDFLVLDLDAAVLSKIRSLPNGALLSTYLHANEKTETVEKLVLYLNGAYKNIRYVRADDYVRFFMKLYPRPVLIKADLSAHWAFLQHGALRAIRKTDVVAVREDGNAEDGRQTLTFTVDTERNIPLVQIEVAEVATAKLDGQPVAQSDVSVAAVLLRQVPPGSHKLDIVSAH